MMGFVPIVHALKDIVALMNRQARALFNEVQFAIRNESCDFDNDFFVDVQTCHFKVHPDKVVAALQAHNIYVLRV